MSDGLDCVAYRLYACSVCVTKVMHYINVTSCSTIFRGKLCNSSAKS